MPWFLYTGRTLKVSAVSAGAKVVSLPDFTGYTSELLHKAILSYL